MFKTIMTGLKRRKSLILFRQGKISILESSYVTPNIFGVTEVHLRQILAYFID